MGDTQLSLLPRARLNDPSTSKQAAARMAPSAAGLEAQILEALRFRALTDDSLCLVLGVDVRKWPSVKTARSRLFKSGQLAWTGEVLNRQRVWTCSQNLNVELVPVAGDRL